MCAPDAAAAGFKIYSLAAAYEADEKLTLTWPFSHSVCYRHHELKAKKAALSCLACGDWLESGFTWTGAAAGRKVTGAESG